MLLRAAPESLVSDRTKADKKFRSAWIELGTNYTLTADGARNDAALRKDAAALEHVLSVLEGIGDTGVLLVPDTNSLETSAAWVGFLREVYEKKRWMGTAMKHVSDELVARGIAVPDAPVDE